MATNDQQSQLQQEPELHMFSRRENGCLTLVAQNRPRWFVGPDNDRHRVFGEHCRAWVNATRSQDDSTDHMKFSLSEDPEQVVYVQLRYSTPARYELNIEDEFETMTVTVEGISAVHAIVRALNRLYTKLHTEGANCKLLNIAAAIIPTMSTEGARVSGLKIDAFEGHHI